MDRKWRLNRRALQTVLPYPAFAKTLPPGGDGESVATPTDLYSVYSVLHVEEKEASVHWNSVGGFYYFVATFEEAVAPVQPAAKAAGELSDEEDDGWAARGASVRATSPPGSRERSDGDEEEGTSNEADGPSRPASRDEAGPPGGGQEADAPSPPAAEPEGLQIRRRTQVIVPVSSSYGSLTPRLLSRLFTVRGVSAQQLLLALVDGNGVVSRTCLWNYVQAPLEGPGTADLELLDD